MSAEVIRLKPTRPCTICGKPSTQTNYPFCSGRCQDVDLNRWLSGAYVIPAKDEPEAEDAETEVPSSSEDDDEA